MYFVYTFEIFEFALEIFLKGAFVKRKYIYIYTDTLSTNKCYSFHLNDYTHKAILNTNY